MALSRDALLKGQTLKRETVTVGIGEVVMRQLSVAERLRCNRRFLGIEKDDVDGAYRAAIAQVVTALCNDDGTPMFSADEIDGTVGELMESLPNAAAEELIAECSRIQGVKLDDVREAAGNSDATPSAASS